MTYIFLENPYAKFGEKASPRPFYKNSKLSMSLDQQSKMLSGFFIVCPSGGLPKYIKIKMLTTCFYLKLSFFKKQKRCRTCLPTSFSA